MISNKETLRIKQIEQIKNLAETIRKDTKSDVVCAESINDNARSIHMLACALSNWDYMQENKELLGDLIEQIRATAPTPTSSWLEGYTGDIDDDEECRRYIFKTSIHLFSPQELVPFLNDAINEDLWRNVRE